MKDLIPGGLADGMSPGDFDQDQLAMGIEEEMEHTSSKQIATEIAMDHLVEDPQYYTKLKRLIRNGPSDGQVIWGLVGTVSAGACAYHGYRRNQGSDPMLWAIGWAFFGAALPIIAVPVALAQGFGDPQ